VALMSLATSAAVALGVAPKFAVPDQTVTPSGVMKGA